MALVTHQAIVSNMDMGPAVLPMGPEDCHGGVSAFGAHRAARGDGIPAHALRHAGDLLREPHEAARRRSARCGPPSCWRPRACGSASIRSICTELRKRPAAARKAFYGGLALALAAARYRREGKPVPLRIRAPLKLPTGFCSARCARVLAGACAWRRPAPRR